MRLSIIVAMDDKQLIGKDNALPWRLSADLAYFKKTTNNKTVLMGRKTYDSIGKPLPNRRNLILSRTSNSSKNRETFSSIRQALDMYKNEKEVFVIGGMSVYEQFLNPHINKNDLFATAAVPLVVDRLYITQIEGEFEGDTYFPAFNRNDFVETFRDTHLANKENPYTYHFIILDRKTLK